MKIYVICSWDNGFDPAPLCIEDRAFISETDAKNYCKDRYGYFYTEIILIPEAKEEEQYMSDIESIELRESKDSSHKLLDVVFYESGVKCFQRLFLSEKEARELYYQLAEYYGGDCI